MKKLAIALGILTGFLAFAGFAFAQYSPLAPLPIGPGGTTPATWTLSTYLTGAIKLLVASAGALAVVMLVIGGTQYVAAGINPSAKGDAKERIGNALIGLILVLTSYLILNSIDPKLVQFNLSLSPVAAVPMKAYTAPTVVKKVWGGSIVSGGTVNTTPVPVGGTVSVAAGSSLYVSADTPVVISSPAVITHLDGTTTNVPLSGTSTTVTVLAGETLSFPSGSFTVTLPEGGNVALMVGGVGETKKLCPSQVDSRVVEVDGAGIITGPLIAKTLAETRYNTSVGGTIYAFKFTTPDTSMQMAGSAQGVKTTEGSAPLIVLSSCKGDYGKGGKSSGCYSQGTEVTSLKFSLNFSDSVAAPNKYCHLVPGKTYWVHVVPSAGSDSPTDASYYFNAQFGITPTQSSAASGDPGIGKGLWIPPSTTGRLIADQSGTAQAMTSYVPGCLNGNYITSASASGCGGKAFFTGPVFNTNTSTTFSFGSGKILGLRYMSKVGAGTTPKYFQFFNGAGGNVGVTMKVWLSDSPTATYSTTASACRDISTTSPAIMTGPGYCPIIASKLYYLFMSVDSSVPNQTYKVQEAASDFQ